jgi:hypothetical protein
METSTCTLPFQLPNNEAAAVIPFIPFLGMMVTESMNMEKKVSFSSFLLLLVPYQPFPS